MQLNIIKPMQKKVIKIAWIDIETVVGNFVIQSKHAPMIVVLAQNSEATYCLNSGKQETISIIGGFAHVTRDYITLLLQE